MEILGGGYRSIDRSALAGMASELTRTAAELSQRRVHVQSVLAGVGVSSNVPTGIALVEEWLNGQATDAQRRAAAVEPVHVQHEVTPPVFHHDRWSGLHLRGYTFVGIDYRHLGRETRAVTDTFDYAGGWEKTVERDQNRHVYQVAFGLGMGNVALGEGEPQTWRDGWATTATHTTYRHDGRPETAAHFRQAITSVL